MGFYLTRYRRALRVHDKWALLALLAPVLYLIFAVFNDLTFKISQDFSPYYGGTPVVVPYSPVRISKLEELVEKPDLLFLDEFALPQLQKKLGLLENGDPVANDSALRKLAHSTMSLTDLGDARLRLSYHGKDQELGRALVGFYTDRLLKRINDGMLRTAPRTVPPGPLGLRPVSSIAVSDIVVIGERSVWDAQRLLPAVVVLALSCLGVLVLIAVLELTDPSFKSERQMARYLGVPALGALPNAEPLVRRLPN